METLLFIASILFIHFLGLVSPGPDFAIVVRNSIIYSRRTALFTALGIALGIIVHVSYSLLGISYIIAQSIVLFSILKYAGAAYLLYIGIKALRSKKQTTSTDESTTENQQSILDAPEITAAKAIRTGFLTNVLNPKATLFFFAIFTQFINPTTAFDMKLLLGVLMVITTFVWFATVSFLFSAAPIRNRFRRFAHIIDRTFGALIIALGIKVALSSQK